MKRLTNLLILSNLLIGTTSSLFAIDTHTLSEWPDRPYLIAAPAQATSSKNLVPVILSLHGSGSNAFEQRINTCANGEATDENCLETLGNKEGFAVIYPSGVISGPGCRIEGIKCYKRYWNIDDTCNLNSLYSEKENTKSISNLENLYLRKIILDAARKYPIDTNRIYISGMSNGAAKAASFACNNPNLVKGAAAIGGIAAPCECSGASQNLQNLALIHFHGTTDPIWSYAAANNSFKKWLSKYNCKDEVIDAIPDLDANDGTRVFKKSYPSSCATIKQYKIEGGGHTWPNGFLYSTRVGKVTRDIDGNQIMWDFFQSAHTTP
ncbi:MAG: hypothetical protein R3B45_07315 [Bdellovibrionota bacterium]